jgi:hypothetical protein
MDITNCTKEELAQAVLELTVELGKTRRSLKAALEVNKTNTDWCGTLPKIDPLATDPRHVV